MGLKYNQGTEYTVSQVIDSHNHTPQGKTKSLEQTPNIIPIRRILMSPRMWLPFSRSRSTPPKSKQRIAFLT